MAVEPHNGVSVSTSERPNELVLLVPARATSRTSSPQLATVATPADLVDRMHQLKVASGLTYRQISDRAREAGDFLPSSTLAGALARHTLPRAELVAAFVRACTDDEQTVQSWTRARNALTLRTTPTPRRPPTAPDPGAGPSSSPAGHRRAADHGRRPLLAFVLGALFAATVSRAVTRSPQRFADGVPEAA